MPLSYRQAAKTLASHVPPPGSAWISQQSREILATAHVNDGRRCIYAAIITYALAAILFAYGMAPVMSNAAWCLFGVATTLIACSFWHQKLATSWSSWRKK